MTAILVSLQLHNETTLTTSQDGQETVQKIEDRRLRAHLILTPDGDQELEKLGFLHLHIEAQPRRNGIPDMNSAEMLDYLREALKKML